MAKRTDQQDRALHTVKSAVQKMHGASDKQFPAAVLNALRADCTDAQIGATVRLAVMEGTRLKK